jgi:hypothetical protein
MSRSRQAAVYGLGSAALLLSGVLLIFLQANGPIGSLAVLVLGVLSGYLARRAVQLVYRL